MVVPNRHVSAPEKLDVAEAAEVWALMVAAKRVLAGALCPDGYNVGFNLGKAAGAGVESHLHLHLVPRWTGDTNFMPVLEGTRVISQHLLETYDLLAPRLSEVSGVGAGPSAAGSE
jgi:ATP adenylyltransferase